MEFMGRKVRIAERVRHLNKISLSIFGLLILLQSGCTLLANSATNFGATQAVNTARGAQSIILIIEPIRNLADYNTLEFHPFQSAIGNNISPELLRLMNRKVAEELRHGQDGKANKKRLIVRGEVIHIDQGTLGNSIVVKVFLADGQTSQSLGLANVEGREEGFLGIEEAASGVASGVVRLLKEHKYQAPL